MSSTDIEVDSSESDILRSGNNEFGSIELDSSGKGSTTLNSCSRAQSKKLVICLAVSLSISLVVVLVLAVTVVILSVNLISSPKATEVPTESTTLYRYPLFHTTDVSDRGFIVSGGIATQSTPLEGSPFLTFMKNEEDGVFMMRIPINKDDPFQRGIDPAGRSLVEVTLDIYCCPNDPLRRNKLDGFFHNCILTLEGTIMNVITTDESTVESDIEGRMREAGGALCLAGEVPTKYIHMTREAEPQYICSGVCQRTNFDDFLDYNPSFMGDMRQMIASELGYEKSEEYSNSDLYEDARENFAAYEEFCKKNTIDGEMIKTKDMVAYDEVDTFFHDTILGPWCSSFETALKNDQNGNTYNHLCKSGIGACVVNVIVSLGVYHKRE